MRNENENVNTGGAASGSNAPAPLTCSIKEFAEVVGISRDHAYELMHSDFPPPGFRGGKGYRVITSKIPAYVEELYERELSSRGLKWR